MDKEKNTPTGMHPGEQIKETGNEKPQDPVSNPYDNSAIYMFNRETGKWEVRNPAGSIGYNYLYRDDL